MDTELFLIHEKAVRARREIIENNAARGILLSSWTFNELYNLSLDILLTELSELVKRYNSRKAQKTIISFIDSELNELKCSTSELASDAKIDASVGAKKKASIIKILIIERLEQARIHRITSIISFIIITATLIVTIATPFISKALQGDYIDGTVNMEK